MTQWLDFLAEATEGEYAAEATVWLAQLMKPTAPGMCGSCHSVDRSSTGGLQIQWSPQQVGDQENRFTFFSHAPHVLQKDLADCRSCHAAAQNAPVMESYQQFDPRSFTAGFHALAKQDCATCHVAGAAGDSCTQCHRYHAGQIAP
jgi:hypothetical protein